MNIKFNIYILIILLVSNFINAQNNIGIGTTFPDPSSILDLTSSTQEILVPRMSSAARMIIASPANGLLVFDNDSNSFWFYDVGNAVWIELRSGNIKSLVDADNDTKVLVEKNPDEDIIRFDLGGSEKMVLRKNANGQERLEMGLNTSIGKDALFSNSTGIDNSTLGNGAMYTNTTGSKNTALGSFALNKNTIGKENTAMGYRALYNNISGDYNTAIGDSALHANTSGYQNTAVGNWALQNNSSGVDNTGIGLNALLSNTSGRYNTALGSWCLKSNTTAYYNTAVGNNSMYSNTTGTNNTVLGHLSLRSNTIGNHNTAVGKDALFNNTSGIQNTATGLASLYNNIFGTDNTANGVFALHLNTTGNYNTALGSWSLYSNSTAHRNTAVGNNTMYSMTTGIENTGLGAGALRSTTNGNNNTAVGFESGINGNHAQCTFIGSSINISTNRTNVAVLGFNVQNAQCTANNQILLGNTAITHIRSQVISITAYSDSRFKTNVSHNVKGLDFIKRLKPVTYNQNPELLHRIWGTPDYILSKMDHSDIKTMRFIGFLAQDVEQAAKECGFVFPGIDVPQNEKEVYTLRYTDFIMPMVKSIQEQQIMIEQLQKENQELKLQTAKIDVMEADLNHLKLVITQNKN
ncbi:MAG: tail fiber domain-containing protein [Saprospiraceae bacterium]|nr:tail fiber domain-containing protein [Saprospiraceae bacterium]